MKRPSLSKHLGVPAAALLVALLSTAATAQADSSSTAVDSAISELDTVRTAEPAAEDTQAVPTALADVTDTTADLDSTEMRVGSVRRDSVSGAVIDTGTGYGAARAAPPGAPGHVQPDTADTGYIFWRRPFVGASFAWGLGSFPVFHQWREGLPDSLSSMGLTSPMLVPATGGAADSGRLFDTLDLVFDVKEPPSSYNISFPIGLFAGIAANEHRFLACGASFIFARKTFQAVARDDSMTSHVAIRQSLGFYSASLSFSYHRAIPERYFAVSEVDQSWLSLGIGLNPLVYLRKSSKIRTPHGSDSLLTLARDHMSHDFGEFSSYGMGASWQAGFTTMRRLSPHTGIQTGLHYVGRWFRLPRARPGDISYRPVDNDTEPLSFISHRLLIRLALLRGRKRPDTPPPPAGAP